MELFQASVRLQPDDDYAHSQAVVTSQHLKRYDDALWHAQAALKVHPQPEYHLDVGSALVKLGRYAEALSHLKTATAKMPDSASACVEMGLCLIGLGDSKEAPTWLERGFKLGGGDFRLLLLAAGQHVKSGKHEAARKGYDKAIKGCRDREAARGSAGATSEDDCVLAHGRALEHRQRFCDWGEWPEYARLESVMLARKSDERVLTPFQINKGPFSLAALRNLTMREANKKPPPPPLHLGPVQLPPPPEASGEGGALRVGFLWTSTYDSEVCLSVSVWVSPVRVL